jgi:protein dithiol oxidoreductase (disulfide-forming)
MKRSLPLLALLAAVCFGACSRGPSQAASAVAPQPSAAAAQPASTSPSTTTPAAQAASQAPAAQAPSPPAEESAADTPDQRSTASLERLAALPAPEQLPVGRWKAGVNYNVISPAQPTTAKPGKVEVMEVFWLGCPHCYAFEPYLRAWLKKKPSYIQFVRVPVMWGPIHRLHAHLFYTLEALGRDDLVEKAYDTIHLDDNPLIGNTEQDTFDRQLAWVQTQGIKPDAFRTAYNSFGVNANLEQAQVVTERFSVEAVPEIIVAGKYSSNEDEAGGHEQILQLIDFLAAFEHHRTHSG